MCFTEALAVCLELMLVVGWMDGWMNPLNLGMEGHWEVNCMGEGEQGVQCT